MKQHAEGLLWLASFGCLFAAALDSLRDYIPIFAVGWAVTTAVVVPLHFIKSWSTIRTAPNRHLYTIWVGFETLFALAVLGGLVWLSVSDRSAHSVSGAREVVLRTNLRVMRDVLNQHNVDLHRRPQSLQELVAAGYLRKIPTDPMTGRNDSWTLEWSNDPKAPGIKKIHSSST
jgi:general secretion pathway protein G